MQTASKNGTRGIMAVIAVAAAVGGNSRLNDYRLERESCCAGSL